MQHRETDLRLSDLADGAPSAAELRTDRECAHQEPGSERSSRRTRGAHLASDGPHLQLPSGAVVLLHAPLLVPSDAAARGGILGAAAGRAQCQCTKNRLGGVLDEPPACKTALSDPRSQHASIFSPAQEKARAAAPAGRSARVMNRDKKSRAQRLPWAKVARSFPLTRSTCFVMFSKGRSKTRFVNVAWSALPVDCLQRRWQSSSGPSS